MKIFLLYISILWCKNTLTCGYLQIDAALEDLAAGVRDLCDFHQQEGVGLKETSPPRFLSDVSQDNYHQTEDHYLSELIAYTKKQFFKVYSGTKDQKDNLPIKDALSGPSIFNLQQKGKLSIKDKV